MRYTVRAPDGSLHVIEGPDSAAPEPAKAEAPPADDGSPSLLHTAGVGAAAIPRSFAETGLNLASQMLEAMPVIGNAVHVARDLYPNNPLDSTVKAVRDYISKAGPQPKNLTERLVNAAGEGIGALPYGGPLGPETSLLRAVTTAAGSGAAGQTAAEVTDNPVARIVASMVGGVPLNAADKYVLRPGNARKMAAAVLDNIPKNEIDPNFETTQAAGNQATTQAQGIPALTGQAFENAPDVQSLQQATLASGKAPKSTSILNKQVGIALGKANDAIQALPGDVKDPLAVGQQTQAAAATALGNTRKQINAEYEAQLAGGFPPMKQESMQAFADSLNATIDQAPNSNAAGMARRVLKAVTNPDYLPDEVVPPPAGRPAPTGPQDLPPITMGGRLGQPTSQAQGPTPLSPGVAPTPSNPTGPQFISNPITVKRLIDEQIDKYGQTKLGMSSSAARATAGAQSIRNNIRALFQQDSPQFAAANEAREEAINSRLKPRRAGPLGQVAGTGAPNSGVPTPDKITSILDAGETPGVARSPILSLARPMNQVDPDAFPTAVKSNLANKLAEATKTVGGQLDPKSIDRFVSSTYGNAAQKNGFKQQLVGVAEAQGLPGNALYPGAMRLWDTLGRLVKRPVDQAVLSPAQYGEMAASNPISNVIKLFGFSTAAKAVGKPYANAAFRQFDNVFSSPEGVKMLQTLAAHDPMGKVGQTAIISFLAGKGGQIGNQPNQNQAQFPPGN